MPDFDAPAAAPTNLACPICHSRAPEGTLFCARCGGFLKGDGSTPEGLNFPLIHLLAEVAGLQRELLHQFQDGRKLYARQFQRALQLQSQQLEKTLAHTARQTESAEQRIQIWQRWTLGLAAAVVLLVVVAVQLAG